MAPLDESKALDMAATMPTTTAEATMATTSTTERAAPITALDSYFANLMLSCRDSTRFYDEDSSNATAPTSASACGPSSQHQPLSSSASQQTSQQTSQQAPQSAASSSSSSSTSSSASSSAAAGAAMAVPPAPSTTVATTSVTTSVTGHQQQKNMLVLVVDNAKSPPSTSLPRKRSLKRSKRFSSSTHLDRWSTSCSCTGSTRSDALTGSSARPSSPMSPQQQQSTSSNNNDTDHGKYGYPSKSSPVQHSGRSQQPHRQSWPMIQPRRVPSFNSGLPHKRASDQRWTTTQDGPRSASTVSPPTSLQTLPYAWSMGSKTRSLPLLTILSSAENSPVEKPKSDNRLRQQELIDQVLCIARA